MTPEKRTKLSGMVRQLVHGEMPLLERLLTHRVMLMLDAADEIRGELSKAQQFREFYKRRCEALQAVQDKMRDPERKAVCDILANGSTDALTPNAGNQRGA